MSTTAPSPAAAAAPAVAGVSAAEPRRLRDHLPALDGLRGIAVLLVVWHHLPDAIFGSAVATLKFVARPGYLGVDVFFVLSGFLITRILLHDRAKGKSLFGFLKRRFARIFPVYYITLLVVGLWKPGAYIFWCAAYLCNFLYAVDKSPSPLEHTWSLAVEEHFYLAWPFLVYAVSATRLSRLTIGVIFPACLALAVATALLEPRLPAEADGLIYRITWYRVLSLALGGLFAIHETWLREAPRRLVVLAIALGVPSLFIIPTTLFVGHQWVGPIMLLGFTLFSGAVVLLVIHGEVAKRWLGRWLRLGALRETGRISYGLYLVHVPLYFAFGLMGRPPEETPGIGIAAVAVVASFLLAHLSYRFIERPILFKVGSTLAKPRTKGERDEPR